MQDNGLGISSILSFDPFTVFPVQAGVGFMDVTVSNNGNNLFTFTADGGSLWMNRQNTISPVMTMVWGDSFQKNSRKFIAEYSNNLLEVEGLTISSCPAILLYGFTLYTSLCLRYNTSIAGYKPKLSTFVQSAGTPNTPNPSLIFKPPARDSGAASLRSSFSRIDISTIASNFEFIWQKLIVRADDSSLSIQCKVAFENPTVFAIVKMEHIGFFLELMDIKVAKVTFQDFGLVPDLNNAFDVTLHLKFLDEQLDPKEVQKAIELASASYAATNDFKFALSGPFNISSALFTNYITEELKISGTYQDLLALNASPPQANTTESTAWPSLPTLYESSDFAFKVLASHIEALFEFKMYAQCLLKPPLELSFPYGLGFNVYGAGDVEALQVFVSPTDFLKNSSIFWMKSTTSVIPINTDDAAVALAGALNPILSQNSHASSIGLKGFSLLNENKTSFAWCKVLFDTRIVKVGIPAFDKRVLLGPSNDTTESAFDMTKVVNGVIAISQLESQPGMEAVGNLNVPLHLDGEVGFMHLDITIDSVDCVALELPNGIFLSPLSNRTSLNATAVLSKNSLVSSKLQQFADSKSIPSIGISGLRFGQSREVSFVTFSKVVVGFNNDDFASRITSKGIHSQLPAPGAIKLTGLDLDIQSASKLSVSITSLISNPYPFSLSIGSIQFKTLLDSQNLAYFTISPLSISAGTSSLSLQVQAGTIVDDSALAEKVALLYKSISENDGGVALVAGLTSFILTPVKSSPSGMINQFEPVYFSFPVSHFIPAHSNSNQHKTGIVDYSAFSLSSGTSISQLFGRLEYVKFLASANQKLQVGADFSYSNPIPASLSIPYVTFNAKLDGKLLTTVQTTSILIARGGGSMKPRLDGLFVNQVGLPDDFALLVESFKSGTKFDGVLELDGIYFGINDSNRNGILSKISFIIAPTSSNALSNGGNVSDHSWPAVSVQKIDLSLNPGSQLSFESALNFIAPYIADLQLSYIGSETYLDEVLASKQHFSLSAASSSTLNLIGSLVINDVDSLADRIGLISDSIRANRSLPGFVQFRGISFGMSENDSISLFSKLAMKIPLSGMVYPSSKSSSKNFKITGLTLDTLPARTVKIGGLFEMENNINVTINGFGFWKGKGMIEDLTIFDFTSFGFDIQQGVNTLPMQMNATFPSSLEIQDRVALFAQTILSSQEGLDKFQVGGFVLGISEVDHIQAFRKVFVGIPPKYFANPMDSLKRKSVLSTLYASKVHISTLLDNSLAVDVTGGFKDALPISEVGIGYLGVSLSLENNTFANILIPSGLPIKTLDGSVGLDLVAIISFHDDDLIKGSIATLASDYLNERVSDQTFQISGLLFGIDNSTLNFIDTFSKVSYSIPANVLVGNQSEPSDVLNKIQYSMKYADMDIFDESTISSSVNMTLDFSLGLDLQIDLPFFSTALRYNDSDFLSISMKDSRLKDGYFQTNCLIYSHENKEAFNTLVLSYGKINDGSYAPLPDTISFSSFTFGFSESDPVRSFSNVSTHQTLNSLALMVRAQHFAHPHSKFLLDTQVQLRTEGVIINMTTSYNWTFFHMKASGTLESKYHFERVGPPIGLTVLKLVDFSLPVIKSIGLPNFVDNQGAVGLRNYITNFAAADLTRDSCFGYANFIGSNGKVFTHLDQARFYGDHGIDWTPYVFDIFPDYLWSKKNPYELQLPFRVELSFPNNGSLHLDLGELHLDIKELNHTILSIRTTGNMVIFNANEGASGEGGISKFKVMERFKFFIPFSVLNPFNFLSLIETLWAGDITMDYSLSRDGKKIEYFSRVMDNMPPSPIVIGTNPDASPMGATLAVIFASVRLEFLGTAATNIPIIRDVYTWIESLPAFKSTTTSNTVSTQSSWLNINSHF